MYAILVCLCLDCSSTFEIRCGIFHLVYDAATNLSGFVAFWRLYFQIKSTTTTAATIMTSFKTAKRNRVMRKIQLTQNNAGKESRRS